MHGRSEPGGAPRKSIKDMVLEPVLTDGLPELQQWLEGRLDTVLGPSSGGADTNAVVQNVTYQYNKPPPGPSPFGTTSQTNETGDQTIYSIPTANKSDKGELSPLQLAGLKGWARAVHNHELPTIWTQLQGTNDVDDARRYINHAWDKSRKELGLDIGECTSFYLEDQTIKDWKKCKFAPGGPIPVWDYLMKGMSILLCTNF